MPPPPPSFAPPAPFSAASIAGVSVASDSSTPWGSLPAHALDADAMPGLSSDRGIDADEDSHYKAIFDDFVATKRTCGESIAGLTLDKFKDKLRGNRDALMSKHQCRTVRFAVYVKDGRAALKATPIRD
jgi:hypothetical protein